jgi:putative phosphoesterase
MITLGIIADTHVPDRRADIDPRALDIFRRAKVDVILHAGDVSVRRVLIELEEIAPVHAVRGNRDWISLGGLPLRQILTFEGVRLGMVHGHGTVLEYLFDKVDYVVHGLDDQRYKHRALATFPDVDVIIFGHLHIPVNEWVGSQLLFNPGSACCPDIGRYRPALGLLQISGPGDFKAEIIPLAQE